MAVISSIIAAAGLAVGAFGAYENYTNSKSADAARQVAAGKQSEIAGLQASNVDVQKQQLDLQTQQQQLQIATQKSVIEDQSKADAIRMQAAELDATRRRRQAIREGIVASSTGLVRATAQGAGQPGSTATAQSRGSIGGQVNQNILGITQNLDVGRKLFEVNKDITAQYLSAQDTNSAFVDKSKTLQDQVLTNQKQIYTLGGDANLSMSQAASFGSNASTWGGLSALGFGVANSYDKINRVTSYFGSGGSTSYYSGATSSTGNANGIGGLY